MTTFVDYCTWGLLAKQFKSKDVAFRSIWRWAQKEAVQNRDCLNKLRLEVLMSYMELRRGGWPHKWNLFPRHENQKLQWLIVSTYKTWPVQCVAFWRAQLAGSTSISLCLGQVLILGHILQDAWFVSLYRKPFIPRHNVSLVNKLNHTVAVTYRDLKKRIITTCSFHHDWQTLYWKSTLGRIVISNTREPIMWSFHQVW